MATPTPPEVSLELSHGQFRLLVDGIALNIVVKPAPGGNPLPDSPLAADLAPRGLLPETELDQESAAYYKEISQEMYCALGRLAKELNVSLQDLSLSDLMQADEGSPGEQFEQAQMQLSDVIQMTEKATLNILDSIDEIREDCQEVQSSLDELMQIDISPPSAADDGPGNLSQLVAFCQAARQVLPELVVTGEAIQAGLEDMEVPAPAPAGSAPEAAPPEPEAPRHVDFSPAVILQTIYEFCTNETVKKHLKTVLLKNQDALDADQVNQGLNDLSQTLAVEDNFLNFPVDQVLKILATACREEQGRVLLEKMAASSGKIFLDMVLPMEIPAGDGPPADADAPPAPEAGAADDGILSQDDINSLLGQVSAPDPAPLPDSPAPDASSPLGHLQEAMGDHLHRLRQLASQVQDLMIQSGDILDPGQFKTIETQEYDRVVAAAQHSQKRIQRIAATLSRIIEALAFQDLSGQRLLKVSKMLRQLQIQLLTMLVGYGVKLKKKDEDQHLTVAESDALAQDEVDRLISTMAPAAVQTGDPLAIDEGQPLNQTAVNDLLASLGF